MPDPVALPDAFLTRPLAHRAYHGAGRPENSLSAIRAAMAAGYGIEIDIQPSRDGTPMVFHDDDLERLTGTCGAIAQASDVTLAELRLNDSDEAIPTLNAVLSLVAGLVPILIEVKDQDGALGPDVGLLEERIADLLRPYPGPVAVMSFNPHSVAALADKLPDTPRGLTTCAFDPASWGNVPASRCAELAEMPDYDRVAASFISHDRADLTSPHVARIKHLAPVLTWTIRSAQQETTARRIADNITFESYPAPLDPS